MILSKLFGAAAAFLSVASALPAAAPEPAVSLLGSSSNAGLSTSTTSRGTWLWYSFQTETNSLAILTFAAAKNIETIYLQINQAISNWQSNVAAIASTAKILGIAVTADLPFWLTPSTPPPAAARSPPG